MAKHIFGTKQHTATRLFQTMTDANASNSCILTNQLLRGADHFSCTAKLESHFLSYDFGFGVRMVCGVVLI